MEILMSDNQKFNHLKYIQQFEQASTVLEPFANFISVFFRSLVDNGFERPEALVLTEKLLFILWEQAFKHNNENGE
jgi:hypothetical protein